MIRALRLTSAVCLLLPALASAQLQQRKPSPNGPPARGTQNSDPASNAATPVDAPASLGSDPRLALPSAAEGEYRWGETGEVIQLYLEGAGPKAELRGYLTRRSERHDPNSAPMTFAFAQATTNGDQISFSTRHIHGDWYSFRGSIARGPGRSHSEDGYYLLNGTLDVHLSPSEPGDPSASDEPVSRQVSLKLLGSQRHTE